LQGCDKRSPWSKIAGCEMPLDSASYCKMGCILKVRQVARYATSAKHEQLINYICSATKRYAKLRNLQDDSQAANLFKLQQQQQLLLLLLGSAEIANAFSVQFLLSLSTSFPSDSQELQGQPRNEGDGQQPKRSKHLRLGFREMLMDVLLWRLKTASRPWRSCKNPCRRWNYPGTAADLRMSPRVQQLCWTLA